MGVPKLIMTALIAGTVIWVVRAVLALLRRRMQLRMAAEFQAKLLERAGSAREFGEFLNSAAGMKLLDSLTTEREVRPQERIAGAQVAGLVLLVVGLAIFLYAGITSTELSYAGWYTTMMFFALVVPATGVGLLIASRVSYRLWKRMGLIEDKPAVGTAAREETSVGGGSTPSV
jgi:predicted phage tail protein